VQDYLDRTLAEAGAIAGGAAAFRNAYGSLAGAAAPFLATLPEDSAVRGAVKERDDAAEACFDSLDTWTARIATDWSRPCERTLAAQTTLVGALGALATACHDLVKDVDLAVKLATRVVDSAEKDGKAREHDAWDGRTIGRLEKELDGGRKDLVEQLKQTAYCQRQAHWLLTRFPNAEFEAVPGLCRAVSRALISPPPTGALRLDATSA
jgi:type I restriction enzyme M protein